MTRYPEETSISVEDFENCGWQGALENAHRKNYSSMCQALSNAAKEAVENGRPSEGRVLWLLADSCSMMLKPNSLNEPFKPMCVMDGKRTALPEDFQSDDITLFSEIYWKIQDSKLCARISDLAWLLEMPRDPKFALSAIDNYRQITISKDGWIRDGRDCWDRAIQLCFMLGAGAEERLKEIEKTLVETLHNSSENDGYLTLWLAELLAKHKLAIESQGTIAKKLEELAAYFQGKGDRHSSRDYFDLASELFKRSGEKEKSSEMIAHCAEEWVKEAVVRLASQTPSHMVAARFYESAIQKYRAIPKAHREKHNVDARIAQLRLEMNKAGKGSLDEMSTISSDPIDISELVNNAKESVRGKSLLEALLGLVNIYGGAKANKIRELSVEMLSEYPLQAFISATHFSRDGRVIAKRPGVDFGVGHDPAKLWPEMVKNFLMELGIAVHGSIWPALAAMRQEHRLRESDFLTVARQSPIVPQDRAPLIAKALFFGYDNDFVGALHFVIPQLEHLVRYHLKQAEVKTTNLDSNGIENENGLSTLMECEETKIILGEDLAFEIKALFCDSFGPNLRNNLAHGLIGFEECQSIYSIYAWWLMLRIVFKTFWNVRQGEEGKNTAED